MWGPWWQWRNGRSIVVFGGFICSLEKKKWRMALLVNKNRYSCKTIHYYIYITGELWICLWQVLWIILTMLYKKDKKCSCYHDTALYWHLTVQSSLTGDTQGQQTKILALYLINIWSRNIWNTYNIPHEPYSRYWVALSWYGYTIGFIKYV